MSLARSMSTVLSLPGSILVVDGGGAAEKTTDALPLKTMTFAAGPTKLTARAGCVAFVLPQDHSPRRALFVGGHAEIDFLSTTGVLMAAD